MRDVGICRSKNKRKPSNAATVNRIALEPVKHFPHSLAGPFEARIVACNQHNDALLLFFHNNNNCGRVRLDYGDATKAPSVSVLGSWSGGLGDDGGGIGIVVDADGRAPLVDQTCAADNAILNRSSSRLEHDSSEMQGSGVTRLCRD